MMAGKKEKRMTKSGGICGVLKESGRKGSY